MNPPMEIDELVSRSKQGRVTDQEISQVADLLASGQGGPDTYQLLYVIARCGARSYRGLVERFLNYQQDPMVASLALQTLCTFWGMTADYLKEVEQSLRGIAWDCYDDMRRVAITAAGEFLRNQTSCPLLGELQRLSRSDDDENLRRLAVEALGRAVGKSLKDVLDPGTRGPDWDKWAAQVIAQARERFKTECM